MGLANVQPVNKLRGTLNARSLHLRRVQSLRSSELPPFNARWTGDVPLEGRRRSGLGTGIARRALRTGGCHNVDRYSDAPLAAVGQKPTVYYTRS